MNIPGVDRNWRRIAAGLNGTINMRNQIAPNEKPLTDQAKEELLVQMWKRFPKRKGQESFGLALLPVAAKYNLVAKVAELVPSATEDDKAAALDIACQNKSQTVVDALLAAGVDINAAKAGEDTVIFKTVDEATSADFDFADYLLAKGANINSLDAEYFKTALYWATLEGDKVAVDWLLERKANLGSNPVQELKTLKEQIMKHRAERDRQDAIVIALDQRHDSIFEKLEAKQEERARLEARVHEIQAAGGAGRWANRGGGAAPMEP